MIYYPHYNFYVDVKPLESLKQTKLNPNKNVKPHNDKTEIQKQGKVNGIQLIKLPIWGISWEPMQRII